MIILLELDSDLFIKYIFLLDNTMALEREVHVVHSPKFFRNLELVRWL